MAEKTIAQRFIGTIADAVKGIWQLLTDPEARGSLGLNSSVNIDPTATEARIQAMDAYFASDDPTVAGYIAVIDDVIAFADDVEALLPTLVDSGAGIAVSEYLDFLFVVGSLNAIREKLPFAYYTGRVLGFIEEQGTIQSVHQLELGRVNLLLRSPAAVDYFGEAFSNFNDQLRADLALGGTALALKGLARVLPAFRRTLALDAYYGWDSLPGTPTPVENYLERSLSLAFSRQRKGECTDATLVSGGTTQKNETLFTTCSMTPTTEALQVNITYVADELDSKSKGAFFATRLQSTFGFDVTFGSPDELRLHVTFEVAAPFEFDFFIGRTTESQISVEPPPLKIRIEPEGSNSDPTILLGSKDGSRLEVGRFTLEAQLQPSLSLQSTDYFLRLGVEDAALVIKSGEGDGFIQKIFNALTTGGELKVSFDLALGVAKGKGFFIEGGTGLRVTLALGKQLGPVRLETLVLGINAKKEDGGDFKLAAEVGASLSFRTTGVSLSVDQMGLEWQLAPLGRMGFRPPKGLALSIDLGGVSGGGYLFFDSEKHEYAGAVHLAFLGIAINGVGLVQTYTAPDGSRSYAFVIILSVEFPGGLPLGFGFTLNGVGGLFGQNRGVSTEALQQGIKSGALDIVLFPQNPVENAPRIISTLSSVFPVTDGQTIFGPMFKLGWGQPKSFIEVSLGLIIEFESPNRLVLLGKAVADFPDKEHSKLHLELDCVGIFSLSTGESSFDASLYRSTLGPYTLMGDIVWRSSGAGRPFWILAIGGTNPHFEVPKGLLPPMNKVGINLVTGDNPRAWLAGYTAITSNTFQIGGAIDASYSKAGFSLSAHIGADALINTSTFRFIFDFSLSVALKRGSSTIASIGLSGTVSGPKPLHFDGRASISFFFFSVSFHVSFTIGSEQPAPLPSFDVSGPLLLALQDPHNWSGALPESEAQLVSLTKATGPSADPAADPALDVIVHPLGQLVVRERVAPLGVQLQRFGSGKVSGDSLFKLDNISLGAGVTATSKETSDFFAAGDFLELTDAQRLSRPAFENMQSGLVFEANASRTGEHRPVAIQYKTIVRKKGAARQTPTALYAPSIGKFMAAVRQGAAALSPLRASGLKRFAAPGVKSLSLSEPLYTVVSSANLRQPASLPARIKQGVTYVQAVQALQLVSASGTVGALHVGAIHEVKP